ncbi:MAG: ribonuclease H-like domain-containing protein, partial [Hungatella sp.]
MITVEHTICLPDTYPLHRLGTLEELLFFDIETTGFSGDYSNLYLIGCTYYTQNSWHLIQWFADT